MIGHTPVVGIAFAVVFAIACVIAHVRTDWNGK